MKKARVVSNNLNYFLPEQEDGLYCQKPGWPIDVAMMHSRPSQSSIVVPNALRTEDRPLPLALNLFLVHQTLVTE